MRANMFPVLAANYVQKSVVQSPRHRAIEHLEELGAHSWLREAQTSQERRFEFRCQLGCLQRFVPENKGSQLFLC